MRLELVDVNRRCRNLELLKCKSMSQGDYPVDFILESIESAMPPRKQPKVLLFDIGGVCVVSPFQGILNYEIDNNIPPGWINFSISRTSPTGAWHQMERGEAPLDDKFFEAFNKDLRIPKLWADFWASTQAKRGLEVGETPPMPQVDGEFMFWEMMRISREPDPWMWPALKALHASGKYIIAALSNTIIFPESHPFSKPLANDPRNIFDVFVSSAHCGLRKPDIKIYEYALGEVNKYAKQHASTKGKGLNWEESIKPSDVVFLDDIGENLKAAKKAGFGTIRVHLGEAYEAVDQLEELTGLRLAGSHPRVSSAPKIPNARL